MSSLFILIPLALLLLAIAVCAFLWAVDHDQFEEFDRAANSILFDDDVAEASEAEAENRTASEPDRTAE